MNGSSYAVDGNRRLRTTNARGSDDPRRSGTHRIDHQQHARLRHRQNAKNLPVFRQVESQANPRLLDIQKVSHYFATGEDMFDRVAQPNQVDGQSASALRFGPMTIRFRIISSHRQGPCNVEAPPGRNALPDHPLDVTTHSRPTLRAACYTLVKATQRASGLLPFGRVVAVPRSGTCSRTDKIWSRFD